MSITVDIPGGTAVLREASEMRGRDRNLIKAAAMAASSAIQKMGAEMERLKAEGKTDEEATAGLSTVDISLTKEESLGLIELREATIVASLLSWSRDEPLPTSATIGDLPADLYDALDAAIGGAALGLNAGTEDFSPTPKMDEEVPTGSSGSSDGPSKADPESMSTPTLPTAGESTATESSTPA